MAAKFAPRWRSVNKPGWLNSTGNEYQFTSQAADDLFEIWSYVAGDSIEAANRVEAAIQNQAHENRQDSARGMSQLY